MISATRSSNVALSVVLAATLIGLMLSAGIAAAADPEPFVTKSVVIIKSTSSFQEAKAVATQAADRLGVRLDLRDVAESNSLMKKSSSS